MMSFGSHGRKARQRQLLANLSLPAALEEAGPPAATLQLASVLTLLVGAALVWAGVTRIDEVATASGQIVPAVPVQSVQHLEGGIIDRILVSRGSVVAPGDELLRLRAESASADFGQLRVREASLEFQIERLAAYIGVREPDFGSSGKFPNMQRDQRYLLQTQREADQSERGVLLSQADQQRLALTGLRATRGRVKAQLATVQEQADLRQELFDRGVGSRLASLDGQRAVQALEVQLAETDSQIGRAEEAVKEVEARLIELESVNVAEAQSELAAAAAELAEVNSTIAKLADRFDRLVIRAPVGGVVQSLAVETVGGVIAPGQELLTIVPSEGTLLAEVRISPKDIGHIQIGQMAVVKVSAFDVARLGDIAGSITHLSATTLLDEDGNPFYQARIALEQNHVGDRSNGNFVLPGMVVTADVQTGSRTVLQYLAGPALRTFEVALRER